MHIFLTHHTTHRATSDISRIDWGVLAFLMTAWGTMVIMSIDLGLYSDDYWNLFEVHHRSNVDYFVHHLSNINSRYTYALVNKLMYHLFFDPDRLFAPLYVHAARIMVLTCHFSGIWLAYRILSRIGVPKTALLVLLPFISFPLYADQALFWTAAAFAYPVGFVLMTSALYALLQQRPRLFAVLAFFSLGATEFVILPLLFGAAVYGYRRYRQLTSRRRLSILKEGIIVLAPFVAWALIVGLTPAAASRDARIHGHPKLFVAPAAWAISFVTFYLRQLQPAAWMREHWYVAATVVITVAAFLKKADERRIAFFLIAMYAASMLPLSAVGYQFRPVSHARLWYFPGFFFYVAAVSTLGFGIRQLFAKQHPFLQTTRVRRALTAGIAFFWLGIFVYFAIQTRSITAQGEKTYACARGFLDEIYFQANGRTPRRVQLCGMPKVFHNFSVFLSPNAGRFALGVIFDTDRAVPFSSKKECVDTWGRPWDQNICPAKVRYSVQYRR